jgi:peroxiredoxin family protein
MLLSTLNTQLTAQTSTVGNSVGLFFCFTGLQRMKASELELAVLTRLELAAVSVQRQHTLLAAKYLSDAMKLLQSSAVLGKTNTVPGASPSTTTKYGIYSTWFIGQLSDKS